MGSFSGSNLFNKSFQSDNSSHIIFEDQNNAFNFLKNINRDDWAIAYIGTYDSADACLQANKDKAKVTALTYFNDDYSTVLKSKRESTYR